MDGVSTVMSRLLDPRLGGHAHVHERWSRRKFLAMGATGGAVVGAAPLLGARPAFADDNGDGDGDGRSGTPRPIPGQFAPDVPFHVQDPSSGGEPNVLTDFKGFVAVAYIGGTGTDTANGQKRFFQVDNRFFDGTFVGTDGKKRHATFGFF